MIESHLYQKKDAVDEQRYPPIEELQEVKEQHDGNSTTEEDALSEGDGGEFSRIPSVMWYVLPDTHEDEGADCGDTHKDTQKECKDCLCWCKERAHAQKHDQKGCRRKQSSQRESEDECVHSSEIVPSTVVA